MLIGMDGPDFKHSEFALADYGESYSRIELSAQQQTDYATEYFPGVTQTWYDEIDGYNWSLHST